MKYLKYLFIGALALAAACSSDPTDKTAQIQREALLATHTVGIYSNGETQFAFDKQSQQLYIDPQNRIFRIQDDQGEKYLEVTLSGMPTANTRVDGTIRGSLATQSVDLTNLVLLRYADECLWLWSDNGHWGLVLPWPQN